MNTFMDALTNNEKSYTANDGTAYRTSGSTLVDLNFSVPALRQVAVDFYGKSKHNRYFYGADRAMDAVEALRLFITSYEEDPLYTMKWLMYARHIKLGLGERDVFRMMLTKIGDLHPEWHCSSLLVLNCGIMVVGMMCYASSLIRRVVSYMMD